MRRSREVDHVLYMAVLPGRHLAFTLEVGPAVFPLNKIAEGFDWTP